MDSSWSYDSEKGFMLSNGAISPPDLLNTRTKNDFTNWGFKGFSYGYELTDMMISSHQNPVENQRNFEVGSIRKRSSNDSLRNYLTNNGSGGDDLINTHSNTVSGDDESSSRLTNPFVDSSSKESSLIDLKLGRFGDNLIIQNATISTAPVISCADSSTPAKRVKASALNSQPVYCQVYGCNKDLGSSKDYHKRHKVCDVHSKTAKVIVNGLEQRFCQQCSRFHLLGEFDDGKRSCRRRLAGHNERRRKPQVGAHSGRPGRLIHSYNGINTARPNETSMTATSFICQDILPRNITNPHPKLRDGPDFECCWVDGQFLQKQPLYDSEMTANVFNGNSFNQYHHPHNIFDTESSGCALSLLSSQTQTSSGMPSSSSDPLMGNFGLSDQVCQFGGSSNYQQLSSVALSDGDVVGSDFSGGFVDGGPSFNGEGATIDLLQLSSQLQRVEHHRQAVSVKQEDETFCCLKIT